MTVLVAPEVQQLIEDAERYRFLRENWLSVDVERPGGPHGLIIGSDNLDEMIDRYRREDHARAASQAEESATPSAAA